MSEPLFDAAPLGSSAQMPHHDYDLLVLGAGAAGLTASGIGAMLGARTLLVDHHLPGGDCTWTGCVPSKALLGAAATAHAMRTADRFGLEPLAPDGHLPEVMTRVRSMRRQIYDEADAPDRLATFGIEFRQGRARFLDPHSIELSSESGEMARISARRFVIATGARPLIPSIDGLDDVGFLTSESLFEIERVPRSLAVIGAGPTGLETAQAFARLGCRVTVLDRKTRPLTRDEPGHAEIARLALEREGVEFVLGATITAASRLSGVRTITFHRQDGSHAVVRAEQILVAAGRRPNIEGLGLVEARVAFTEAGIRVNERCRTGQQHIYAAGDVTGEYKLTHMSEHMAKVAVMNALLRIPARIDRDHVAWATYTDPEVAGLGASRDELRQRGRSFETFRFPMDRVDRAVIERRPAGEVAIYATPLRGRILGASAVGPQAGEIISLLAVAMKSGATLRTLADTIIPYPTYALAARRAADQWYVRRRYPSLIRALRRLLRLRGREPKPADRHRIV